MPPSTQTTADFLSAAPEEGGQQGHRETSPQEPLQEPAVGSPVDLQLDAQADSKAENQAENLAENLARPQDGSSPEVPLAEDLSRDAFWGGKVTLCQPKTGFRAGTASVLLAAWLPPTTKGRVIDLGAGVGTLGLLAASRLPGLQVLGFERVPQIAALANQNARDLGLGDRVKVSALDIFDAEALDRALDLTPGLGGQPCRALICNPPFTGQAQGRRAADAYRASAHQRPHRLEDWLSVAKSCLVAGGWCYWVLPASELQAVLLAAARCDFGAAKIMPVQSFAGRPARLMLLALRKNRRGDSQILPPLVLYDAPKKPNARPLHTAQARAILMEGRGIWEVFPDLSPT